MSTTTTSASGRTWTRWAPRKPGQGGFLKWAECEVGYELEGEWQGQQEGTYGPWGSVERDDGQVVRFSLPAVLKDRLDTLPAGAVVRITYMGKQGPETRQFHTFDVYVDLATVPETANLPPDSDVPF